MSHSHAQHMEPVREAEQSQNFTHNAVGLPPPHAETIPEGQPEGQPEGKPYYAPQRRRSSVAYFLGLDKSVLDD